MNVIFFATLFIAVSGQNFSSCVGPVGPDVYEVFLEELDFDSADNVCIERGGRMASIRNKAEHDLLKTFIPTTIAEIRFGLKSPDETNFDFNNFFYVDGSDASFVKTAVGVFPWSSGEPNFLGGPFETAKFFPNANFLFDDFQSAPARPYMCRIPNACPHAVPDFESCVGPDLFEVFREQLDFDAADAVCVGRGGRLASIKNTEEIDLLKTFIPQDVTDIWIGLRNTNNAALDLNAFIFIDGADASFVRTAIGEFPWFVNEPSFNEGTQLCGRVFHPEIGYQLDDFECNGEIPYMCRIPFGCPTSAPTTSPTALPSPSPTISPTASPSETPTESPSTTPTKSPSSFPTSAPASDPTTTPTFSPEGSDQEPPLCKETSFGINRPFSPNNNEDSFIDN